MPRNVRNFWLRARADGLTKVETGPRAADGGMHITLLQRSSGEVVEALDILCRWLDGKLTSTLRPNRRWVQVEIEYPDGTVVDVPMDAVIRITSYR